MKITTTPYSMIKSELINSGFNEFSSKHQLTFFEDDFQFIKKMMRYDEDVEKIVNDKFFQGIALENKDSDIRFKQAFLNRFLNRQISRQSLEAFSAQIVFTFLANEKYINFLYDEIEGYLKGQNTQKNTGDTTSLNDNRYLQSELPQTEVNLNVDDTVLDYGNTNTISRTRDIKTDDTQSESEHLDLGNLEKFNGMIEEVFNKFDKNCFLQTW